MSTKSFERFISESLEVIESSQPGSVNFRITSTVSEASMDAERHSATLTVIEKGWSKNGFYYTDNALEDIKNHLNATAGKVYLNHNPRENPFKPREVQDHIADSVEAWVEDSMVKSRAKFLTTGPHAFVFERMVEAPKSMGPSIVGKATVTKGEVEGVKGNIVQRVDFLHSYDMVSQPAAGGAVDEIFETVLYDSDGGELIAGVAAQEGTTQDNSTEEVQEALRDVIARKKQAQETSSQFFEIEMAFFSTARDLILADGDFAFASVQERRSELKPLMDDFSGELGKLKFIEPKALPKRTSASQESVSEDTTVTQNDDRIKVSLFTRGEFQKNTFRKVSINKSEGVTATVGRLKGKQVSNIRSYSFAKSKGWTEAKVSTWIGKNIESKTETHTSNTNTKEGFDMELKTVADLKSLHPDIYAGVISEAQANITDANKVAEYKEGSEKVPTLETNLKAANTEIATLKESNEALEADKKVLKESNEVFEALQNKSKASEIIAECKKSVDISEDFCSEDFNAELVGITFESVEKFTEAVTAKLTDRKALVTKLSNGNPLIEGVGNTTDTKSKENVSEGTSNFPIDSAVIGKQLAG